MKSVVFISLTLLTFNLFSQPQNEYRLQIENLQQYDVKSTLGEISDLFAPCSTTHSSDGTFIFLTYHDIDTSAVLYEIHQLGYLSTGFTVTSDPNGNSFESFSAQKALNQDCSNSLQICSNVTFSGNSDGIGTQELDLSNHGCLVDDERQSSWYYLNVGVSGTLGMDITPANGNDDYDFAIWGPFTPANLMANCAPTAPPIRCNFTSYPDWFPGDPFSCGTLTNPTGLAIDVALPTSSNACTDEPYSRHLDVVAGEIYIMIIDNWSTSLDPFDITWSGTGELICTPIPLPTEFVEFQAKLINGKNCISWTTTSERDNDYFKVQRKSEYQNWTTIEKIDGAGTSGFPISYQYVDVNYNPSINYYRIIQRDYNGTETTHVTAFIDNRKEERKIQSCVNLFGQVVDINAQCLKIIIYEDGSKILVLN